MRNAVTWLTLLAATGCYDRAVLLDELKTNGPDILGAGTGSEVEEGGQANSQPAGGSGGEGAHANVGGTGGVGAEGGSSGKGGAGGVGAEGGSSGEGGAGGVGAEGGSSGEGGAGGVGAEGGSSGEGGAGGVGAEGGSSGKGGVGAQGGVGGAGQRPIKDPAVAAACSVPVSGVESYSSLALFEQAMVGDWYLCSDPSIACTEDEIGVRILADGTWTKLYYDASGAVIADSNLSTWRSFDMSLMNGPGSYGLNGVLHIEAPALATGGQSFFSQGSMTQCTGIYVKSTALGQAGPEYKVVSDTPVEPTPLATVLDDAARAACAIGSTLFDTTSLTTMQSSLQGVWIACADDLALPPSVVGLEVTSDGKWYHLYADSDGKLYRGLGWGRRGSYTVLDTSSMNGPGHYQVNFEAIGVANALPRTKYQMEQLRYTDEKSEGFYRKIAP